MLRNLLGLLIFLILPILFAWLVILAWRSRRTIVKWPGLLLCRLLALAFGLITLFTGKRLYTFYAPRQIAMPHIAIERTVEQVVRGEHIAGYVCKYCHSANGQLPLSGGLDLNSRSPIPVGSLIPFNLTTAGRLMGPAGEYFLFTLAAQVTTLAVVAYYFQRLSLVSLLSNPLILPAQPAVEILGGLALILGLIWLPLGQVVAYLAWPFLVYTIRLVQ